MAKAKQLPSGSWRVRIYDGELKKQISFTSNLPGKAGKAEAELMAQEYLLGRRQKQEQGLTVGECIDEYIALKENVLSPTTIDGYRKDKRTSLVELCDVPLKELTPTMIQAHVNKLALTKSPKSIRNAHGLLSAALNVYAPDMRINTTLPQKKKIIKQLPTVEAVLQAIRGTDIELPCLLALWLGMRMSEIRGAKRSNIKDGILTVKDTVVNVAGRPVERDQTKTVESTRRLKLPEPLLALIDALPPEQDILVTMPDYTIRKHLYAIQAEANLGHFSFHDLRHLNASVMLALGIPDKYAMERGGWSSNNIMKSVYQHTFTEERKVADDKIDNYFSSVLDTILDTNSK